MSKQLQLNSLQQGRGLAAMAVVAFHLSLLLGNSRYLALVHQSPVSFRVFIALAFNVLVR